MGNQCPDCGSNNAVSKDVAWDALCETPPRVAEELAILRKVEREARKLVTHPGDENTVVVSVPKSTFDAIREAVMDYDT